jgi:hypothetical protein
MLVAISESNFYFNGAINILEDALIFGHMVAATAIQVRIYAQFIIGVV